jgi:hypothetical protein
MPPSHALAAKVAATRAAQAATTAATRTVPIAKPAAASAPPAAKPTAAPAHVPATPSQEAAPTRAQAPATSKSIPLTAVPAKPAVERNSPAAAPKPLSPPPPAAPAPAARSTATPPTAPAKPAADVPVLTVEFESSPEVGPLDEEEFSFDLALSAGQIDAVLAKDLSDVPVLTEPVDSMGEEPSADDSMLMQFDEETQHKLANLEALANAKALEDISNSMAETLFGDAELDKLAATLALATEKHDDKSKGDEPQHPAKVRTAP